MPWRLHDVGRRRVRYLHFIISSGFGWDTYGQKYEVRSTKVVSTLRTSFELGTVGCGVSLRGVMARRGIHSFELGTVGCGASLN